MIAAPPTSADVSAAPAMLAPGATGRLPVSFTPGSDAGGAFTSPASTPSTRVNSARASAIAVPLAGAASVRITPTDASSGPCCTSTPVSQSWTAPNFAFTRTPTAASPSPGATKRSLDSTLKPTDGSSATACCRLRTSPTDAARASR